MNDNTRPTLFEQLPVEIFLKIFALFSFEEVVKTFSSLNSDVNSRIRGISTAASRITYNNTRAIGFLCLYPTQIGQLIIIHSPTVDFTSLNNLRSLTLKYGTQKQFDGIRPQHFPHLKTLHLFDSK